MQLQILLLIQKEMVSQDGSLTESVIIKKEKISKSHPISSKPNSEKMLKDSLKLEPTEVLDINGDSRLEVNTLRLQVEEEEQLVSKERKND